MSKEEIGRVFPKQATFGKANLSCTGCMLMQSSHRKDFVVGRIGWQIIGIFISPGI